MDDLFQQESELEDQIKTYRFQLSQVEGRGPEMTQLMADLSQLIALTEENLMELKKQKLLLMLHNHEGEGLKEATTPSLHDPEGEGLKEMLSSDEEEEEDAIIGMKCGVPLNESWSGESHHNAVILLREPTTSSHDGDFDVRVLFSQPMYTAMKPCPYLLDGSCKYSEEDCKYSHGHVTQFSKLRPFSEPDHSLSHISGKCLAKHKDGLWYHAIISSIGERYVVYFPSLSVTSQVSIDDVIPLESSDDESCSDDGGVGGESESEEVVVEWRASANNGGGGAIGQWERHTNGIGSKLLFKMGYVVGQGLGKLSQGRVNPVEIVILPAGKSLDVCAELREANKVRKMEGVEVVKSKRKKKKTLAELTSTKSGAGDMFDFLNTKVFSQGARSKAPQSEEEATSPNLNVKLFTVQEKIKSVEKRKQNLKESLLRHRKRKEKQLIAHTTEKLAEVEEELKRLHKQEKLVENNITTKSERKKISIF